MQLAEKCKSKTFIFCADKDKGDASKNKKEDKACIVQYIFHNVSSFGLVENRARLVSLSSRPTGHGNHD